MLSVVRDVNIGVMSGRGFHINSAGSVCTRRVGVSCGESDSMLSRKIFSLDENGTWIFSHAVDGKCREGLERVSSNHTSMTLTQCPIAIIMLIA